MAAAEAKREEAFEQYKAGVAFSVDYDEETIQRCERAFYYGHLAATVDILRALEERAEIVV